MIYFSITEYNYNRLRKETTKFVKIVSTAIYRNICMRDYLDIQESLKTFMFSYFK